MKDSSWAALLANDNDGQISRLLDAVREEERRSAQAELERVRAVATGALEPFEVAAKIERTYAAGTTAEQRARAEADDAPAPPVLKNRHLRKAAEAYASLQNTGGEDSDA